MENSNTSLDFLSTEELSFGGGHDSFDVDEKGGFDDSFTELVEGTHDFGIPHALSLPSISQAKYTHPFPSAVHGGYDMVNATMSRFMSVDNVAPLKQQARGNNHKNGKPNTNNATPLDSLKDLVRFKNATHVNSSPNRNVLGLPSVNEDLDPTSSSTEEGEDAADSKKEAALSTNAYGVASIFSCPSAQITASARSSLFTASARSSLSNNNNNTSHRRTESEEMLASIMNSPSSIQQLRQQLQHLKKSTNPFFRSSAAGITSGSGISAIDGPSITTQSVLRPTEGTGQRKSKAADPVASIFNQRTQGMRHALARLRTSSPTKASFANSVGGSGSESVSTSAASLAKRQQLLRQQIQQQQQPEIQEQPLSSPAQQQQQQQQLRQKQFCSPPQQPQQQLLPVPQVKGAELHRLCCNPSVTREAIDRVLRVDPSSASRPMSVQSHKAVYNCVRQTMETKVVKESYSYPLNIAIKNKVSMGVIEMLLDAAPSVLLKKDGPQQETPLCVLLKTSPQNLAAVDCFLLSSPRSAAIKDRHLNTPLHIACSRGASLEVVKHLCILYHEPLFMENWHGKTPLKLTQERTSTCSEEVSMYLWEEEQHRRSLF